MFTLPFYLTLSPYSCRYHPHFATSQYDRLSQQQLCFALPF